jgi:hypothetical protein
LRFNFVAAAHPNVRLAPRFLRALHPELFTKPSSTLDETIHPGGFVKSPSAALRFNFVAAAKDKGVGSWA